MFKLKDGQSDDSDKEDPFSLTGMLKKHNTKGNSYGIFEDEEQMNLLSKKNPFDQQGYEHLDSETEFSECEPKFSDPIY